MEWFRFYTRTLDCRKVQGLPAATFRNWVNLLCLSSIHEGFLPPTCEIAFRLRCTERQADQIVADLLTAKLVDRNDAGLLQMHDWNEHQYVSDLSTERVRKHRKKQSGNVSVTPPDTEQIQNRYRTEQTQNGAPMPPIKCQTEWPLTIAEIRKRDPAVDDIFVLRLAQVCIQACLSSRTFPQEKIDLLTDKVIARACAESFATGPPNHRAGLLLNRVPPILISWSVTE